ncbi:hypothetical protein BDD12DRAFT_857037 [Trichophaea hybrida]|nr:hypothetical protein BDD12DRAFT_857037 [Trichophaea hybrida]
MGRPRTRSTCTLSSSSSSSFSSPTCKGLPSIGSEGRVRKSKVRNRSSSKSKLKSKSKPNSPSTTTGPASSRTTTSSSTTATITSTTSSSSSSPKKLSWGDIISQAILQGAQLALSISAEFRDKRAALYRSEARTITESLRRQGKRRAAMKYEADVDQLIAEFMADGERQLVELAGRYQQLAAGAYVTVMAQGEAAGDNATTGTMRGQWLDTVLRKMED